VVVAGQRELGLQLRLVELLQHRNWKV
jgi:hypothetical protein